MMCIKLFIGPCLFRRLFKIVGYAMELFMYVTWNARSMKVYVDEMAMSLLRIIILSK